ncbi:MAG: ATP-grasp domain-containing protein [Planctomycetales bacterium]|nr:ATP-grasp domain-containing protein [Planctomycetales bacterium]
MSEHRQKVLVLGSDNRAFLAVVRSLGRRGIDVHVAWCARDSTAICSKYVGTVHQLSRPPSNDWKSELKELINRERYDLVIPCNDPSILPLHGEREYFKGLPIYLIDEAIFDTVMDKAAVNLIAAQIGIRLPRETVVSSAAEIDAIDALSAPYVLKPTRSYLENNLAQKNHVVICPNRSAARGKLEQLLTSTPVAVQEYFEGRGVGVEFLARDGQLMTAFQHRRLHEPPDGGGSSYRKSCELDEELLAATVMLIERLNYSGVGMAEFRYNDAKRAWIFVELNSRFWGSLPLAVNSGADFPSYLFDLCCENRMEFPRQYRVSRTCRNWALDVRWLQKTLLKNRWSLPKHLSLAFQLISELRYPLMLRESSDSFQWNDPAPAIKEITESLGSIPRRIGRKVSKVSSSIPALRTRSRKRLMRNVANSKSVLFVCKGNICRSPFAERYFRSKLQRIDNVSSSGYHPKLGRKSPEHAEAAAAEFDVDLTSHRSSILSATAVEQADTIFVFDDENRRIVLTKYPNARDKTFMLGLALPHRDPEITDPYGGTVDAFRSIYLKIREAIDCITKDQGIV